jgi:hypothetical protein
VDDLPNKLLAGYMTEIELADELQKHKRTVYRWRQMRQGPPVTLVGNRPLYRIDAVRAWLLGREKHGPNGKARHGPRGS